MPGEHTRKIFVLMMCMEQWGRQSVQGLKINTCPSTENPAIEGMGKGRDLERVIRPGEPEAVTFDLRCKG